MIQVRMWALFRWMNCVSNSPFLLPSSSCSLSSFSQSRFNNFLSLQPKNCAKLFTNSEHVLNDRNRQGTKREREKKISLETVFSESRNSVGCFRPKSLTFQGVTSQCCFFLLSFFLSSFQKL